MEDSTSSSKVDTDKNPIILSIPVSEEETIQSFTQEPPQDKDKTSILKSHVLISFSISNKLLAFKGLYHTPKSRPAKVKDFSPCYLPTMPFALEQHALDLKILDPSERVFQSAFPSNNKEFIVWLDKVQLQQKEK
ncbi:unnamed protein product [Vicia faba]|uniref:Uncharacterized protein n=1 Tax=Vicia faba TaxID=3906 RepID=A0AAV0YSW9_VICFA|nr:unnamed protein product [Vicia faba]